MNKYISRRAGGAFYRLPKNEISKINQNGDNATKTAQMLSNNVNAPPVLVLRCVVLVFIKQ